jgi:hypothetical protein
LKDLTLILTAVENKYMKSYAILYIISKHCLQNISAKFLIPGVLLTTIEKRGRF